MLGQHLRRCPNIKPTLINSLRRWQIFNNNVSCLPGPVFSYKLRYIVGFWLVEMAISTNQKPTIYRNLYENTGPGSQPLLQVNSNRHSSRCNGHKTTNMRRWPNVGLMLAHRLRRRPSINSRLGQSLMFVVKTTALGLCKYLLQVDRWYIYRGDDQSTPSTPKHAHPWLGQAMVAYYTRARLADSSVI